MHCLATSVAPKRIGLGLAILSIVILMTLLFSLLGTICCAGLLGMILGARGQWRWSTLLVSAIFPAVIVIFARMTQTLSWQQCISAALVCFGGGFWGTYLLSFGLVKLERKTAARPPSQTSPGAKARQTSTTEPAHDASASARDPAFASESSLNELQGQWCCETAGNNGQVQRKLIEISNDHLALSLIEPDGRRSCLAKSPVRLEQVGPFRTLKLLHIESGLSPSGADARPATGIWVYRVATETLTIAWNFDRTSPGLPPGSETFKKVWNVPQSNLMPGDR